MEVPAVATTGPSNKRDEFKVVELVIKLYVVWPFGRRLYTELYRLPRAGYKKACP